MRERERERERGRERERERDRQTDRQTEGEGERHRERDRDRERTRQTDRQRGEPSYGVVVTFSAFPSRPQLLLSLSVRPIETTRVCEVPLSERDLNMYHFSSSR